MTTLEQVKDALSLAIGAAIVIAIMVAIDALIVSPLRRLAGGLPPEAGDYFAPAIAATVLVTVLVLILAAARAAAALLRRPRKR